MNKNYDHNKISWESYFYYLIAIFGTLSRNLFIYFCLQCQFWQDEYSILIA